MLKIRVLFLLFFVALTFEKSEKDFAPRLIPSQASKLNTEFVQYESDFVFGGRESIQNFTYSGTRKIVEGFYFLHNLVQELSFQKKYFQ